MTRHPSPHALARRAQNDAIRALYEDTLVPVREIARLAGVTERNIYALVRRLGCRPRVRLASGGGRRIVPLATGSDTPGALDAESLRDAVQRCADAVAQADRLAAASRAARNERAARRQADRDGAAQARALALFARALCDLAKLRDRAPSRGERPQEVKEARPKTRRGSRWKAVPVSSHLDRPSRHPLPASGKRE